MNKRIIFNFKFLFQTIIILLSFNASLFPKTIYVNNDLSELHIGKSLEYLEDKTGTLDFKNIKSSSYNEKWMESKKRAPGFGFTKSVYWVRFIVQNASEKDINFFLEQAYPLIDSMKLYAQDNGKVKIVEVGDLKPFSERPYDNRTFAIPFTIKSKSKKEIYIRYKTESSMNIDLRILSPVFLNKEIISETRLLMLYYGIVLIMIIYNLFVFFFIRRMEYLYYVLYILFFILFIMTQNGTAYQFLYPESPWFANFSIPIFLCLLILFATLFTRDFLEMKTNSMIYNSIITKILIPVNIAVILLCVFLNYRWAMTISAAFAGFCVFLGLFVTIMLLIKKNRMAYFYFIAWLAFFIGALLYIFLSFGMVPKNFFTAWSLQLGSSLQIVLLSIGFADRLNIMRKELAVLTGHLEDKVKERTEELQSAMEELEAVNEKLLEINDQLEDAQKIAKRDMDLAANVQGSLFHKVPPVFPEWDIAFKFQPMSGVSGDFYDFYTGNDELKGLVLLDVSGHGVASGLITMIARTVFYKNFMSNVDKSLHHIMGVSNKDMISEIGSVDNYLTGILLRFKDDTVEYVNAGHPDLIMKRGSTGRTGMVNLKDRDFKGMFLGAEGVDNPYETLAFKVYRDDKILLFTDCINESKNPQGEEYGMNRLIKSFETAPEGSAREIMEYILFDFFNFVGTKELRDDLTVIIVKKIS